MTTRLTPERLAERADAIAFVRKQAANARALNPDAFTADWLDLAADALDAVTRERDEARVGVRTDTERLDWLSRFAYLEGEARVLASDGLRAAMYWDWDPFDGGSLRDAIDHELASRELCPPNVCAVCYHRKDACSQCDARTPTPAQVERVGVTEDMVAAAARVMYPGLSATLDELRRESHEMIHDMLVAALAAPPALAADRVTP